MEFVEAFIRVRNHCHNQNRPHTSAIVPRHAGGLLYMFSYAHSTVPFLKVKCRIPSASTVTFSTIAFHSIGVNSTTFLSLSISCFANDVSFLRCEVNLHVDVFILHQLGGLHNYRDGLVLLFTYLCRILNYLHQEVHLTLRIV